MNPARADKPEGSEGTYPVMGQAEEQQRNGRVLLRLGRDVSVGRNLWLEIW